MRVLLISHTCQSAAEGHPKAHYLAKNPDIHLRVLVPDRWKHYGNWRMAENPSAGHPFEFSAEKVAMPWAGPAQFYLHWYPHLADIMRQFEPDVIDAWEEPWAAVTAQACLLRKRVLPRAKLICETEQNIAKKLPPPFEHFRSYVLHRTDHAIARSSEAIGVLRVKGFRGPVTVVPNGVNPDQFRPMDRESCRQELGLKGFVIGYVGRFVEEKGVFDLLDVVAAAKAPVTLLLIGSGQVEDQLRERAVSAGISDRVAILRDQPHARLPILMNAMDCLVLPSRTTERWKEQFGRVLIEAAACGTPVIGSTSGAIPSVIGKAGVVFPEGDNVALAEALDHFRLDPLYAREVGMAGRTQVEQRYSWQRVAEKMVGVYDRVLRGTEAPLTEAADTAQPNAHSASDPAVVSTMEL